MVAIAAAHFCEGCDEKDAGGGVVPESAERFYLLRNSFEVADGGFFDPRLDKAA